MGGAAMAVRRGSASHDLGDLPGHRFSAPQGSHEALLHVALLRSSAFAPRSTAGLFRSIYRSDIPAVPRGDWTDREARAETVNAGPVPYGERQLHRARAAYYAHITHIDHQIGRFLECLGEYDVRDDTMIVFSSDHGDLLGDHNLFRKGLPYEGSARVPLLVKPPRASSPARAASSTRPVELRDLMPTILDAAGVADSAPRSMAKASSRWRGGKSPSGADTFMGNTRAPEREPLHHHRKLKYIWFSGTAREQFFDLVERSLREPRSDRKESHQEEVRWCREMLVRELTGREEGHTDGRKLIPGRESRPCLGRLNDRE